MFPLQMSSCHLHIQSIEADHNAVDKVTIAFTTCPVGGG